MMGGWGWHRGFGGLGILAGFAMLIFWAAIIGLVVWLVVKLVRSTSSRLMHSTQLPSGPLVPQSDPVLEILRRRLAAGEITSQEYDELRQKLGV